MAKRSRRAESAGQDARSERPAFGARAAPTLPADAGASGRRNHVDPAAVAQPYHHVLPSAAWAAANRATGSLNGEQLT
jgi:hypothetical protein